eukprot:2335408-Prymnesium_polylepis.1
MVSEGGVLLLPTIRSSFVVDSSWSHSIILPHSSRTSSDVVIDSAPSSRKATRRTMPSASSVVGV